MASIQEPIHLERISFDEIGLDIEGISPLMTHKWSAKAKKQISDKQGCGVVKKKEPRDPQAEYESAFYRLPDGQPGFPAAGFGSATKTAARNFDSVTLTLCKQAIHVVGEGPEQLIRIEGDPEFTEMPVRIGMGTADLRYRPVFWPWSASLIIRFNPVLLSKDAVIALVDAGGMGGVGEWRPSSPKSFTGSYGMYQVVGV